MHSHFPLPCETGDPRLPTGSLGVKALGPLTATEPDVMEPEEVGFQLLCDLRKSPNTMHIYI